MKTIVAVLALVLLTGCTSLNWAGVTEVTWKSADGTEVRYISGKDLQGIDAIRSCDNGNVCTVHIVVEEAQGSEAIKANAQAPRDLIEASKEYSALGRALNGMP